ncbi:membrane-bound alpha-1,6- mannosyltransferase Initiation-specific [Mycoblastus sanguinarius]|nr:membrane-bound alpha-1,6- mannosyltransferase Initiation-specific [Mycoblastus sanguinarius]
MLTFRKAAILAVFVLTTVYLLHTSHTATSSTRASLAESFKADFDGLTYPTTTGIRASSDPTRPYPPPRQASNKKDAAQQPLTEIVTKGLREQLQYQFPYDRAGKFPAYIWQTWKYTPASGDFGETFRPAEASWSELHPGFVHEVVTDEAALYLLKHLYASVPDILEAYESLPLAVMKADFFRYLILLARGGIYTDIDTTALKSTTDWIPDEVPRSTIGLIIGIEADPDRPDWKDWYSRRIQFCQWTIQAKPGHPVLRDVVATITEDTLRMRKTGVLKAKKLDKSIVEFTGPALWTDAIFSYLNDPVYYKTDGKNVTWETFTGMETAKKVGDVVVLPITSFSPGVQQMGAKEPDDPMAFVKHDFEGILALSMLRYSILIKNK